MGCGCSGKSKNGNAAQVVNRATVYEVIDAEGTVLNTFKSLPEARADAVAKGARLRVNQVPAA